MYRICLSFVVVYFFIFIIFLMVLRLFKLEFNRMVECFWLGEIVKVDFYFLGKGEGLVYGVVIICIYFVLGGMKVFSL